MSIPPKPRVPEICKLSADNHGLEPMSIPPKPGVPEIRKLLHFSPEKLERILTFQASTQLFTDLIKFEQLPDDFMSKLFPRYRGDFGKNLKNRSISSEETRNRAFKGMLPHSIRRTLHGFCEPLEKIMIFRSTKQKFLQFSIPEIRKVNQIPSAQFEKLLDLNPESFQIFRHFNPSSVQHLTTKHWDMLLDLEPEKLKNYDTLPLDKFSNF